MFAREDIFAPVRGSTVTGARPRSPPRSGYAGPPP